MEQKVCKKCKRNLPDKYSHKYCEHCRNERVKGVKEVGKALMSLAVVAGGTAVAAITGGKINLKK